jgi:hypothetical protein
MENQVIEITYFKPKETVSQEVFGARNIRVGIEYAAKQVGFISRETGVDADGTWVIVVHWETLAHAQASMQKWGNETSVEDFKEMIDPNSFQMGVFLSRAFLKK